MTDAFEWDWDKNASNLIDHKIDFDRAKEIFKGPRLEWLDSREHYGEDRYISLGEVDGRCLVVVHTPRDHKIRIISARKATSREQNKYYQVIHGEE